MIPDRIETGTFALAAAMAGGEVRLTNTRSDFIDTDDLTPEQVADCIRTMAVRGAPAIGLAAAYGLALADDRDAAAELLRSTRPTAVNLAWALDQARGAPDVLEAVPRPMTAAELLAEWDGVSSATVSLPPGRP